ncbi:MAG: hypothetical protein JSR80_06155 [Verrucomicrobia bacterium]|nr:hypothetical protein [Verrucomicrobiota bacterium]
MPRHLLSCDNDYSKLPVDYSLQTSSLASRSKAFLGDAESMYRLMKFSQTVFEMLALAAKNNPGLSKAFSNYALGANIIKSVGQPILRTAKAADYLANPKVKSNDPQLRQAINVFAPWMFCVFSLVPFANFLGKFGCLPQGEYLKICDKLGLYGGGLVGNLSAGLAGIYTGSCDLHDAKGFKRELESKKSKLNSPENGLDQDAKNKLEKEIEGYERAVKGLHYNGTYDVHGGIKYMLELGATVVSMSLPAGSSPFARLVSKLVANGYGVFAHSGYKHFINPQK